MTSIASLKQFFHDNKRASKIASTGILLVAFLIIFFPALALTFQLHTQLSADNCGYGYGYGYGNSGYGYGYGYGNSGYGCNNGYGYGYGGNGYGYGYGYGYGANVADLQVTKSVSNTAPATGVQVTYTITVRNNGPLPENTVTLTDNLPTGVTYVSSSASFGSYNNATGIWNVGPLASGASQTLTIIANVTAGSGTSVTNTGTVLGDVFDPDMSNNTSSATFTVPTPGGGGGSSGGGGGSGGGGFTSGGGGNSGGGGSGSGAPGLVLGDTTGTPSGSGGGVTAPQPQVLGESTGSLPRTGMPISFLLLILGVSLISIALPKRTATTLK